MLTLSRVSHAVVLAIALCLTALSSGRAQNDPPLFNFEADAQGFQSEQGQVGVTQDPANVKAGNGALEWSYDAKSDPSQLQLVSDGLKAGATTLDFWAKSSVTTGFQLLIIERDGSYYFQMMHLPGDKWQHYRVALTDLTTGWTKDENGQLDLDQIRVLQFQDQSRYHGPESALGPRKLWLDGLTFNSNPSPQRRRTDSVGDRLEIVFDDFDHEAVGWESSVMHSVKTEKDGDRRYLRTRYRRDAGGYSVLSDHTDPRYGGCESIKFVARATRATRLVVEIREWDGGFAGPDYVATLDIPAGEEWKTLTLPFKSFKLREGAKDANQKLDLADVWLLACRDDTGGAEENTLDIDRISGILAK